MGMCENITCTNVEIFSLLGGVNDKLIYRNTRMNGVKACFEYYQDTGIKLGVIQKIIELAQQYDIEKVLLFGSRARGDYKRKSDVDLASTGGNFTRFSLDVDELTSTLLQFDIVNLDRPVQKELLESIQIRNCQLQNLH